MSNGTMTLEDAKKALELCRRNYAAGGDVIVECFSARELMDEFSSIDDVKAYCGIRVEQALNCRLGEDTDPELATYERWQRWCSSTKEDDQ